jgi:hypothetical protein
MDFFDTDFEEDYTYYTDFLVTSYFSYGLRVAGFSAND